MILISHITILITSNDIKKKKRKMKSKIRKTSIIPINKESINFQ